VRARENTPPRKDENTQKKDWRGARGGDALVAIDTELREHVTEREARERRQRLDDDRLRRERLVVRGPETRLLGRRVVALSWARPTADVEDRRTMVKFDWIKFKL
jgi:hypothetical protein